MAFQLSIPEGSYAGFHPFVPLPDPLSTLTQPTSQEAYIYGQNQWAPLLSAFPFNSAENQGVEQSETGVLSLPTSLPTMPQFGTGQVILRKITALIRHSSSTLSGA